MSVYAFGAGFFGGLNKRMDEDMAYIREQRQKRRDYLMSTGTEALRKTEATANQAIATANKLKQLGMSDTNINYIVEQSGPNGLLEVLDVVGKTPSLVRDPNALNKIVTGAVETGEPTSYIDTIKQQFGLYQSTPNPVERERKGFFANLGVDPDEAVNAVYNETFAGGYTGADLIRMTTSSGPTVTGAAPIDYASLPVSISREQAAIAYDNVGMVTNTVLTNRIASVKQQISETESVANEGLQNALTFLEDQLSLPANQRNYELLMQELPELRGNLLSIEERVPGSLKYNDMFKLTSAYDILFPKAAEVTPELDEQTKGALGGSPASPVGGSVAPSQEGSPAATGSAPIQTATLQEQFNDAKASNAELAGLTLPDIPSAPDLESAAKLKSDWVIVGDTLYKNERDGVDGLPENVANNLSPEVKQQFVDEDKAFSVSLQAIPVTARDKLQSVVNVRDNILKKGDVDWEEKALQTGEFAEDTDFAQDSKFADYIASEYYNAKRDWNWVVANTSAILWGVTDENVDRLELSDKQDALAKEVLEKGLRQFRQDHPELEVKADAGEIVDELKVAGQAIADQLKETGQNVSEYFAPAIADIVEATGRTAGSLSNMRLGPKATAEDYATQAGDEFGGKVTGEGKMPLVGRVGEYLAPAAADIRQFTRATPDDLAKAAPDEFMGMTSVPNGPAGDWLRYLFPHDREFPFHRYSKAYSDPEGRIDTSPRETTAPAEEAGAFVYRSDNAGENLRFDRTGGRVTQPIMERPTDTLDTVSSLNSISGMVTRLAGEGSNVAQRAGALAERVSSGDRTLRAYDITRIINQVKELPRTEARKALLAELYDLRDEVNNR